MKYNLIGTKIGKLTIVSKVQKNPTKYLCKCDCGNEIIIYSSNIAKRSNKSCGCDFINYKDLIGKRYDKLLVIKQCRINNKLLWLCKCDCGNEKTVSTRDLNSKNIKSCGCLKKQAFSNNRFVKNKLPNQELLAKIAWREYHDKVNNIIINNDLTLEKFIELAKQNCHYCGVSPSNGKENFKYNGLDRIDPSKYHTLDNVVPCCPICNRAKLDYNYNDFLDYLKLLKINDRANILHIDLPIGYVLSSLNKVYKKYKDDGLTKKEFHNISQMPCHYCGRKKQINLIMR